jgi:hypothetical protein
VLDLSIKPGTVSQVVEVTSAPPLLQTQSAAVGQVVGSREVNSLPLNGRNYTFLAQIVAGVNTPEADTRGNAATGAFSANGERPAQNDYLLDGIDNNSNTIDFLNGTNFVVLPPIDAVEEFKVQTSNYSAQIGRAGGAVLNATVKAGTNNLHGDVWEFLRNDKLDAADFFEDSGGIRKGEFRLNQFGFTIGGPVVIPHVFNGRDKLFFFGDYEALRRVQGSVFTNSVPTDLERNSGYTNLAELVVDQTGNSTSTDLLGRTFPFGTIFDPATIRPVGCGTTDTPTGLPAPACGAGQPTGTTLDFVSDPFYTGGSIVGITDYTGACPDVASCKLNQILASRLDPNAIKILNLFPRAQAPGIIANQTSNPPLTERRNAFDTRVDFNKSEADQIFTRISFVDDPQFIPSPFAGIADGGAFQDGPQTAISFQGALGWTHTLSPTAVNEARIGYTRLHTTRTGPVANQLGIPAQFGIQGVPQVPENGGLPAFVISGLSPLGSNAFLPSDEISETTQVAENFTKVWGKHDYKMGFEYQHIKFSTLQPSWSHGEFDYYGDFTGGGNNAIAQILLSPIPATVSNGIDNVGGASAVFTSNIALVDDLHNYYATYFQDDWKLTPKLTLNLGLRWEHFGLPVENHGRQANFVPGPPGNGAAYLLPDSTKNRNLAPSLSSFFSTLNMDGIAAPMFDKNWALAVAQNKNFAPRFGFAYQVSPKLVMRGGFGVFYGGFETQNGNNQGNSFPFQFNFQYFIPDSHTPITVSGPNIPPACNTAYTFELGFSCTPLDPSLVSGSGIGLTGLQTNFQTPYTQGWNLTFEYAFAPSLTLTMGYVGNSTHHLEIFKGTNHVSQILLPDVPTSGPGAPIPFPDIGSGATYQTSDGNSHYNGLQTTLEKRFSGGLNFLATYTWSRCRSDAGDLLNGTAIGNYRAVDVPGAGIQYDFGDCDFDIRHVVHFSGGYQLPFGQGKRFLGNAGRSTDLLAGGWSTQWIATIEGGQPITLSCDDGPAAGVGCYDYIIPGVNRHGSGGPDHFLNPAAFTQPCPPPGFTQPSTCVPGITGLGLLGGTASQVSGPQISRLDFSLFKAFRLSERFNIQFRSEFFNILNHPTFNAPGFGGNGVVALPGSTDFLNSNFGKIGSTRFRFNDPRQIQFALKLYY